MRLVYSDFTLLEWECVIDQVTCMGPRHYFNYSIAANAWTCGLPESIEFLEEDHGLGRSAILSDYFTE